MEKIGQATFVSSSRIAVEKKNEKKVMTIEKLFALLANVINLNDFKPVLLWILGNEFTTSKLIVIVRYIDFANSVRNI